MVNLIDCDMEYFLDYVKDKRIVAFGAGKKFKKFISDYSLVDKIEFVVDNNKEKQGKYVLVEGRKIFICRIEELANIYNYGMVIVITNATSFIAIMDQLNGIKKLDEAECFYSYYMEERCHHERIEYTKGAQKIPKIIHYCWFGKSLLPKRFEECIETWHNFLPEYEFKKWDESNYDIGKNLYMKEAYQEGKYGFVPDFARLDIVYEYGGIYLDVDIEVVKSFDDLLNDDAFFGFNSYGSINLGCGFGAKKGDELICKLKNHYIEKHFVVDEGEPLTCVAHQAPIFRDYGFILNNKQQCVRGRMLYPMEVFAPKGQLNLVNLQSNHTHSIHHSALTWANKQSMKGMIELKEKGSSYIKSYRR